jgi:hypothetical protein
MEGIGEDDLAIANTQSPPLFAALPLPRVGDMLICNAEGTLSLLDFVPKRIEP